MPATAKSILASVPAATPVVVGDGHPSAGFRLLAANLGALFATDIALARQLDALPDGELPALSPTRSGHWTASVAASEAAAGEATGKVALHSRHDPLDEAKRLVSALDLEEKVAFAIHGAGLGYHVAELISRTGTEGLVLLFEPDLTVLRRALECVDLSAALRSKRLTVITTDDKSDLFAAVGARTVMMSMGLATLAHPPSMRLRPAYHASITQLLTDFASYARTSLNTLVINGKRTAENITANTMSYAHLGGVAELGGRFAGYPAIVISAGPSLRRNAHLLKEAKGKAVLIAVQTMLKPLLAMGVEPDFVTSLDYHEISGRFFEDLPAGLSAHLVADPKCTPRVLAMHTGPVSLVGCKYADALLRECADITGAQRPALPSGATVAHLAFYLAQYLGCDPILFVGQDLGFSDNLCYSPGTRYDDVWRPELSRFCSLEMKQWDQIVRERPILRQIPATSGGMMYTEERLFTYLQQFEKDFAEASQRVIDCTEGGALKKGATPMPLAEALATFCTRPLPTFEQKRREGRDALQPPHEGVLESLRIRRKEALQVALIARQTLPLLEEIGEHLLDQSRVNRAIAKIDPLRQKMNEFGATYDLITNLTQRSEVDRFRADLQLAMVIDPHKKQAHQIKRDIANCRNILQAAEDFAAMMDATVERFAAVEKGAA